jgi:phosphoglycerol transferase
MHNNNLVMSNKLKAAWFAGILSTFVYLMFRNVGMQPIVMADEWYYSSFARLFPLDEVSVPSYLYLLISKSTLACGTGYLECARIINVVFFLLTAPLIYLVARRFMNPKLASIVALLSALGPINSYTAYFMPESLYYFAFWLLSWSAFRFHDKPVLQRAMQLGAVLGALALIKVHALFLFPSLLAFMVYSACCASGSIGERLRNAVFMAAIALFAAALVRFGFGYACAGRNGLSLFGSLYGAQASNPAGGGIAIVPLLKLALFNLRGHIVALMLLFAVPFAALAGELISRKAAPAGNRDRALAIYTVLVLLALLAITVGFTAHVAGAGQETNVRLHMRYYNFLFPLLTMCAAARIREDNVPLPRLLAVGVAGIIGLIVLYGAITHWRPYTPSMVDSPEFQGMTSNMKAFYLLSVVACISLFYWVFNQRLGARVFIGVFMPLFTVFAGYAINQEVRGNGNESPFDRAGTVARIYLTAPQRAQLGIVGSDASGIFRAQFHVDERTVWQHMSPQGETIDLRDKPADKTWLLALGDYPAPAGAAVRVRNPEFSIFQLDVLLPENFSYDFSAGLNTVIERTEGLSGIEPWGRWSDKKTVELHFSTPLPRRFTLTVIAEAFGPNAGEETRVQVGPQTQTITFDRAKKEVDMQFETDGTQRVIRFDVPKPTSPRALGLGEDERPLGIGFSKMRIKTESADSAGGALTN